MEAELEKLEANLGGVADMRRQPDAIFIVDLKKEQLAVREAQRLKLPVIAVVDTNCDPDEADFVIPGNDDAIRSCSLIVRAIADGIAAGQHVVAERDFAAAAAAKIAAAEAAAAKAAADEAAAAAAAAEEAAAVEAAAEAAAAVSDESVAEPASAADVPAGESGAATVDDPPDEREEA
jgi:small subunit ribosomal protein S2